MLFAPGRSICLTNGATNKYLSADAKRKLMCLLYNILFHLSTPFWIFFWKFEYFLCFSFILHQKSAIFCKNLTVQFIFDSFWRIFMHHYAKIMHLAFFVQFLCNFTFFQASEPPKHSFLFFIFGQFQQLLYCFCQKTKFLEIRIQGHFC